MLGMAVILGVFVQSRTLFLFLAVLELFWLTFRDCFSILFFFGRGEVVPADQGVLGSPSIGQLLVKTPKGMLVCENENLSSDAHTPAIASICTSYWPR